MSSAGKIMWSDLTVPNAEEVRDFYQAVAGWTAQPVDIGDHDDYSMIAADGTPSAGVCYRLGVNANLPPQWLIYITVDNLDASLAACVARGGRVIDAVRQMGESRFCVIQDPAGAVAALFQE